MRAAIVPIIAMLARVASAAEPSQHPVSVELGPKAYRDGDVIQVTDVVSTSARLEQGDTVTVKGRVRLDSDSDARLCLYLTQAEGDGLEEAEATQEATLKRGLTTFELKTTIKHRGVLHLTLYRSTNGKPFGGVYFGTSEQMQGISDASVQHYLAD